MKKIMLFIIVGLILRLFLMAVTFHQDIRGHYFAGYLIAEKGGLFTFYDYLSRLPPSHPLVILYHVDLFGYPPPAYWAHAIFYKIFSPLYPPGLFTTLIRDTGEATRTPGFHVLIFFLKLPYLLIDLAVLWVLLKIVPKDKQLGATILWAVNLPLIYSAEMIGQFDVLIVLFMLISLYFAARNRSGWAAVFLAVGAGFKPIPLLFAPFLPGNRVKNVLITFLTYLLLLFPYLHSPGFKQYALLANQTEKMWYAKIFVSETQYLPLFAIGLVAIFWFSYYYFRRLPIWGWPLSILLLFYSVTNYHPQWFSWVSPLLILLCLHFKKLTPLLLVLLLCHFLIVFSFEPTLNFGLFGINFSLFGLFSNRFPADQLVSLIRGALAATSLSLVLLLAKAHRA